MEGYSELEMNSEEAEAEDQLCVGSVAAVLLPQDLVIMGQCIMGLTLPQL